MSRGDAGLLGIAFHPQFSDQDSEHYHELFLFYTYSPDIEESIPHPLYERLSRFRVSENLTSIDPKSEEVIFQQYDRHRWHNGGDMFFDRDGFLCISLGDEGGSNDEFDNAQHIDKALFGGIIRIDVDKDPTRSHDIRRFPIAPESKPEKWPENINNYTIPNDNPWLDPTGKVLEEFYAIGLRSPHRISLDTLTRNIWVGDVGQTSNEEISILPKGSNAQWPFMEGSLTGSKPRPEVVIGSETAPIHTFCCTRGNAVIGGFVYRGDKFPTLNNKYIFGDYGTGRIWALNIDTKYIQLLLTLPGGAGVVDFSTDSNGEVYMLKLAGGTGIWKLVENVQAPEPPRLLSETGAFSDLISLTPSEGVIDYEVNVPLWSDRAAKRRWISLPKGEKIQFSQDSSWSFPVGTVFIKHFELPIDQGHTIFKKIETRFLVAGINGGYYGITYQWNDEGTEAFIVSDSSVVEKDIEYINDLGVLDLQKWKFPSRVECLNCHNVNADYVLGVKTSQLNRSLSHSENQINQIEIWSKMGLFTSTIASSEIEDTNKLVSLSSNESPEFKVRSYLDANCSHCHRPGGVEGAFDARITTPFEEQGIVNQNALSRNSNQGNKIVAPKDLQHSELFIRDNSLEDDAMPPLGKTILDQKYIQVLSNWIMSIDSTTVVEVDTLVVVVGDTLVVESDTTIITGLEIQNYSENKITSVYPNPTGNRFEISFNSPTPLSTISITIYNSVGKKVYNLQKTPNAELIEIKNEWQSGIYFIVIQLSNAREVHKLIKS